MSKPPITGIRPGLHPGTPPSIFTGAAAGEDDGQIVAVDRYERAEDDVSAGFRDINATDMWGRQRHLVDSGLLAIAPLIEVVIDPESSRRKKLSIGDSVSISVTASKLRKLATKRPWFGARARIWLRMMTNILPRAKTDAQAITELEELRKKDIKSARRVMKTLDVTYYEKRLGKILETIRTSEVRIRIKNPEHQDEHTVVGQETARRKEISDLIKRIASESDEEQKEDKRRPHNGLNHPQSAGSNVHHTEAAGGKVQAEDTGQHQGAAEQGVDYVLGRRVFFPPRPPDGDEEVHRDNLYLPEQEEHQQVKGAEDAQNACLQQQQPGEILPGS